MSEIEKNALGNDPKHLNRIRYLLSNNIPSLGTRISSTWPVITEEVGASGNFDYVEFLAEYAPLSQSDMENIARAAELHAMGCMMKTDLQNRGFIAQKAVASGFQGLLFCDHMTADEVRETVYLLKSQSPKGKGRFGFPYRRYIGYAMSVNESDHARRLDDVVLAFMIEKKEAMENIEEICRVPGVDMVQFGGSDYSMSMGWNYSDHVEELKALERRMIEVALANGVQPRCELYGEPEAAQYYIDLGVRHFCYGDQMGVYERFLTQKGKKMREIADSIR